MQHMFKLSRCILIRKLALVLIAAIPQLFVGATLQAQTKFTVQVNKKVDGSTAYPTQVTMVAEDGDGNYLNITPSGGTAAPAYTVAANGLFANFTLNSSPTGSKMLTLHFSKSSTFPAGSTTAATPMVINFAAPTSGLQVGNSVAGPGIVPGSTIMSISANFKDVTVSNPITVIGTNPYTFFAGPISTNFAQTSIPSLLLVSSRAQSFFITLAD